MSAIVCAKCKQPVAPASVINRGGQDYCIDCFLGLPAPMPAPTRLPDINYCPICNRPHEGPCSPGKARGFTQWDDCEP